jgi:hypothetical protein
MKLSDVSPAGGLRTHSRRGSVAVSFMVGWRRDYAFARRWAVGGGMDTRWQNDDVSARAVFAGAIHEQISNISNLTFR